MRKLVLYIAMSLDGYIAAPGDDLGFLGKVEKEGEDYGYAEFIGQIDTVIVGRRTYDWVMQHVPDFIHADKETYIITRTPQDSIGPMHFYTGDIGELVAELQLKEGKNIFCDRGAEVVNQLLQRGLIDEFIISIIPVFIGDGIRLFREKRPESDLKLLHTKSFDTGLVQLHYKRGT
ncbi:dihydrofolate reductase family protein [Dyadobacter sediminis]|uniref:Dihydrofolate reductase n=1 Tax=Dyadobacter sediminis TaxID=1493691 RepID=A0A5R9K763_9BACT|nr:dihydrofolate reductase family protein [Dyadobacter sediminis]TLU89614.1 dihydrofolate reductase [Dyadobacter sediminis]GGC03817.1 diacylglycerol kinase [Dyadobacter sediminis]